MERNIDKIKAMLCFHRPVHKAFVYTFYEMYTQDVNVYSYIISMAEVSSNFTEHEMQLLAKERRPSELHLSLLYKIIKMCCTPSLSCFKSPAWNLIDEGSLETSVESLLTLLMNNYIKFLTDLQLMEEINIENIISHLNSKSCQLIEKASIISKTKRCVEESSKIEKMFDDISKENFFMDDFTPLSLIKIELQFRVDLCQEVLKNEILNMDETSLDFCHISDQDFEDATFQTYNHEENRIESGSVLLKMLENKKRICLIAGDHGVGKSSLAAFLIFSWCYKNDKIAGIHHFDLVSVVSANHQCFQSSHTILEAIFPLSNFLVDNVAQVLENKNVLVIVDDANKIKKEEVQKWLQTTPKSFSFFLLSSLNSAKVLLNSEGLSSQVMCLQLLGLKEENILRLSEIWTKTGEEAQLPSLRVKIKDHMARLGRILKYPNLLWDTCCLWVDAHGSLKEVYSSSELMWELLVWRAKRKLNINIKFKGPMRKKFLQWLMLVGELSLYCLKLDTRLDHQSVEELRQEIETLYPDKGIRFFDSTLQRYVDHSPFLCRGSRSSTSKPFLEYCSSWFLIEQLQRNKFLSDLTAGFNDLMPVVLFGAGHLERLRNDLSNTEMRRLTRSLIHYQPNSYINFSFLQQFVAELKCIRRLVEIVIDESEYKDEWNIDVSTIQQRSLEVLLNHVSPTRLIFVSDKLKENYELPSVMNYVKRVDISVWLDSIVQFSFGNKQKMDKLVQPFLEGEVIPRVDLISGSLSSGIIKELCKCASMQHLTFFRLHITTEKCLKAVLKAVPKLSKLLWLDLKIEMAIPTEFTWQRTNVRLFDIHLQGCEDSSVSEIVSFLSSIHSRYTGIHLENTSLTPEGVFGLLKELKKRGVSFHAEEKSIALFRKWYYPRLSNYDVDDLPPETELIKIIGHEDRTFYSDHVVRSNRFVRSLDAWNLRNFLESEKNIPHFVYEASNIIFTKDLNGEVEITFKGDYKEALQDTVIAQDQPTNIIEIL